MINSKRIDIIAIVLIVIVLALAVLAMLYYSSPDVEHKVGTVNYSEIHSVTFTKDDHYSDYSQASIAKINLNGASATSASHNVSVEGSTVTILGGGTYVLSGHLDNGTVVVDSGDKAEVRLILNNVSVSSDDYAALYVKQSEKTVVSLVDGTENIFTDGAVYNEEKLEDGKPAAAIYSKDSLTINGSGTLKVNGNCYDGIKSNDVLKITEGSIIVTAVDEGLNANDYVAALNADITVNSGGDAIKAEHEDEEKGFIALDNTKVDINGETDGIYASSGLYIIEGDYNIAVGEDAVHGEKNVVLEPKNMDITMCREGIEGAYIEINNGNINIVSYDDGINAVGLNSNGGFGRPMGMHKETINDEDIFLTINGGSIVIETGGDGVDSNGAAVINGGNLRVYGPENGGNSSLDFEYGLVINGGEIIAAGSSGMAELPHETSAQSSLVFYLENSYEGENTISLQDSNGDEIISGSLSQRFDWVCVSTDAIKQGEKYTIAINDEIVAELESTDVISSFGSRNFGGWR